MVRKRFFRISQEEMRCRFWGRLDLNRILIRIEPWERRLNFAVKRKRRFVRITAWTQVRKFSMRRHRDFYANRQFDPSRLV